MEFACLNEKCLRTHHFTEQEPEKWDRSRAYARQGEYRHKCPWCEAAMTPVPFFPLRDDKRQIVPADYFAFSDCPNAGYCYEKGMYQPDCESVPLKKECLFRLYELQAEQDLRLQYVEQLVGELHRDLLTRAPSDPCNSPCQSVPDKLY